MVKIENKIVFYVIILALVFAVIIGIEQIFYNQPFPDTFDTAPYQQNSFLRFILRALVWGGGVFPNLALVLVYSAIHGQRHRAFLHLAYFDAQYIVITMTRSLYHQPRPYEQYPDLYQDFTYQDGGSGWYAYTCQASYGLPSGHALSCMAISVYIALDFILARRVSIQIQNFKVDESGHLVKTESKITPQLNLLQKTFVIIGAILYSTVVGFARFYEKADTLNQIMFGWALGIWLAVVFAVFVRDPLYSHVKCIVQCQNDQSYLRSFFVVLCISLGALLTSLTIYLSMKHMKTSQSYIDYVTNLQTLISTSDNCYQVYNENVMLLGADLLQSSYFIGLTSAYAGLLYQRQKFDGQTSFDVHQFDSRKMKFTRFFGRLVVNLVILTATYLLLALPIQISQYKQSLVEWYFFDGFIPNLFGCFLLFAFADSVNLKFKLFVQAGSSIEDDLRSSIATGNSYFEAPRLPSQTETTSVNGSKKDYGFRNGSLEDSSSIANFMLQQHSMGSQDDYLKISS